MNILILLFILGAFYAMYKIGYIRSEIKFCEMVIAMLNTIDPNDPMFEYNIRFIKLLREKFIDERGE